jgi:hypothetical protein
VHLFVLPRPHERVAEDLAHILRDRHAGQAPRDRVLAVADRDDLFTLERQKEEVEHLLAGTVRPAVPAFPEPLLELLVDGAHDSGFGHHE